MDLGAALLALLIVLVVKGAVMVLCGWLLVKVYRSAWSRPPARPWLLLPEDDRPAVRLLWWALALFGLSELTCGVEVYILLQPAFVTSAVHAVASAAGMGLFALGMLEYLDAHLLAYKKPGCVANRICRGCTAAEPSGCKLRLLLLLSLTLAALAALVPMCGSTEAMAADTARFTLPFPALNAWYDGTLVPWLAANVPGYNPTGVAFVLPRSMFVIEFRLVPVVALALLLIALRLAHRGDERLAGRYGVFAAGMVAYALFELVLYRGTGDVILGSLGHEVAEFWFLVFTAELLARCFPPVDCRGPQSL